MRVGRPAGFSILELLIVLAIGAALLGAAIPLLKPILGSAGLRSEARVLAGTIEELSITAQLRGLKILLEIDQEGFLARRSTSGALPFLKHDFIHGVKALERGNLLFSPSGAVSPATITLTKDGARCVLAAALRGRVQVMC